MRKKKLIKRLNEIHDAMIFTVAHTKRHDCSDEYNKGRLDARKTDIWLLEAQLGDVLRDLMIMPKQKYGGYVKIDKID